VGSENSTNIPISRHKIKTREHYLTRKPNTFVVYQAFQTDELIFMDDEKMGTMSSSFCVV